MSDLVTDPKDPRLGQGPDKEPGPQNQAYLILSAEERAKGFVRPVRRSYVHARIPAPTYPLRDLTAEELANFADQGWVKYEEYPRDSQPNKSLGKFWTQADLDRAARGCGALTTMSQEIAETYAREPGFYGSTYCVACRMHLRVEEFVWDGTDERVGS